MNIITLSSSIYSKSIDLLSAFSMNHSLYLAINSIWQENCVSYLCRARVYLDNKLHTWMSWICFSKRHQRNYWEIGGTCWEREFMNICRRWIKHVFAFLPNHFWLMQTLSDFQPFISLLQYRHLIPASVDRTSASDLLYEYPWVTSPEKVKHTNGPRIWRIKTSFSFDVRDMWSHPWPGNLVAIGRAVVHYARAAHAFSAGIQFFYF